MSIEYTFDVAFSFLQRDEPLALQLNDRLQDRVKTFIYTEQQKVVAGTDGEETFHRVFGKEARIVVVLFRKGWGESRWTRIEETAIRNRGHEHGYRFTVFIPLEEPPTVPEWLPSAQVWVDLNRFGTDAAAAVIDARIQDSGGQVHQESIEEHARRIERAMQFDKRREAFQGNEGVRTAQQEFANLKKALAVRADSVKNSSSIALSVGDHAGMFWITGLGRALGMTWQQEASNHLKGAFLHVRLMSHLPPGPGQWMFEKPTVGRSMRFAFNLLPSEAGGWFSDDAQPRIFSTDTLAEYLTKFYLENGRPT